MIYLLRLFKYLKKYPRRMVFSMFFLVVYVTFNMIQPKLMEWVIDKGIDAGITRNIIYGAAGILFLGLFGNASSLISRFSLIKAGQGLSHDVRCDLFKKIVSFSFVNFDKWRTGEFMVRCKYCAHVYQHGTLYGRTVNCDNILKYHLHVSYRYTSCRYNVDYYGRDTYIVPFLCQYHAAPFHENEGETG